MPLQPVFKPYSREQLEKDFDLNFGLSEWVAIRFPVDVAEKLDSSFDMDAHDPDEPVEYETNRYDASLYDVKTGETISAYFYMDENSEKVLAIDTVVQSHHDDKVRYSLNDTPFGKIVRQVREKAE
jgi:hypothetical protein